jgi:hypothetical protein
MLHRSTLRDPLSRSQLRVKRTWLVAVRASPLSKDDDPAAKRRAFPGQSNKRTPVAR